jgi:hypothetical protein
MVLTDASHASIATSDDDGVRVGVTCSSRVVAAAMVRVCVYDDAVVNIA